MAPHTGWTSFMSHSQPKLQDDVRLILMGPAAADWLLAVVKIRKGM